MNALAPLLAILLVGLFWVALLDESIMQLARGQRPSLQRAALNPLRRGLGMLNQPTVQTEAPDWLNWRLATAVYLGLGLLGLLLVPVAPGAVVLNLETGIVAWGAIEALTVVIVFLHGWSANSQFSLMGAYRYVAIGLPMMLLSMFVLIAAALPAESLSFSRIIESQQNSWNLIRQPLGLPLFLLLGLSITFRGPFNYADSVDLASGTSVEDSGALRLVWQLARMTMLVSFSVVASTVFLGGYLGPWAPGASWLMVKTLMVLTVLVCLSHFFARATPSQMLTIIWTGLLPASFFGLLWAGLGALK